MVPTPEKVCAVIGSFGNGYCCSDFGSGEAARSIAWAVSAAGKAIGVGAICLRTFGTAAFALVTASGAPMGNVFVPDRSDSLVPLQVKKTKW